MARLSGHAPVRFLGTERAQCDGAILDDDYRRCANTAVNKRGQWRLCAPHSRKDELEVIDTQLSV